MAQTILNINQYGATYGGTSNAYQFYLEVILNSQSVEDNTSNITINHKANGRNGWGYNGFSTPTSAISVSGTQKVSSTVRSIPTSGSVVTLSTWTGNVTHNSDGTLSITVSATYNPNTSSYSYVPRTNTISGTVTLTTIPRASDVSVSNYSITNTSGSLSATITSKANFYHKWRWKIGSGSFSSWTNKGLISTTSSTVTVANTSLLSGMPTSTSATFTIEVRTYSDSGYATLVGTKTATCTVSVNTSNIKPSVTLGNIALNTSPISGYAVAGYSTVKSSWSASGGYGTTSNTTYFTVSNGSLTSTSSTSASGTVTSNTIPQSASNYTLTISAYSKDSRGAVSDTVSKSITVYGYQPPTATLSAYRVADSTSTTEDGAGVYVYVTFSGAVRSTVNSQNSVQSTVCTYSGSISGTATNGQHIALADSQSATFTLTVTDKVTSSTVIVSVAPALYPLDLYDNGQGTVGVGFGTTAESGKVKSALPLEVNGNTTVTGGVYTKGSGVDSRINITDTTHNGELRLMWGSNHQHQGLLSTGYSANGTSLAGGNVWLIYRDNANKVRLYGGKATVDTNGNIRAEGYVSLGGNVYADGGDIHAGTTTKARTANNGVHSVAGKIYLHTEATNTGKRGLWVSNRSDTYKEIISVDQNNEATFIGKLSGSIATVTATLVSSANFTTLSYPSAFTVSNSIIINWAINTNTASNPAWATGHGLASGTDRTFVQQNKTNILFYNNQSAYYGKTVRVVLMKIG